MADSTMRLLTATTTLTPVALIAVRKAGETVDKAVTLAQMRGATARNFYATDYGAKFDGLIAQDVTTVSGNATITSPGTNFTSADVGKAFGLKSDPTSTVYQCTGTILSVSGHTATLSVNATEDISGTAVFYWGTDDTAAIQAAVNAANTEDQSGYPSVWKNRVHSIVIFPAGMAMITSPIYVRTNVGFRGAGKYATHLKWVSTLTMGTTTNSAMFYGNDDKANGTTRVFRKITFQDFWIDMSCGFFSGAYSYKAKCIMILYIAELLLQNMFFDSSPATLVGCDWVSSAIVTNCHFLRGGRLWTVGTTGGGSGLDFNINSTFINTTPEDPLLGSPFSIIVANNYFVDCAVSAVRQSLISEAAGAGIGNDKHLVYGNIVECSFATNGKGIEDCSTNGSVIANNIILHTSYQTADGSANNGGPEGQHYWGGVVIAGASNGLVTGNLIQGGWCHGVSVRRQQMSGSTATTNNYTIRGNVISGSSFDGIYVALNVGNSMKNLNISDNTITGTGGAGIHITRGGTGEGGMSGFKISDNAISDFGQTANFPLLTIPDVQLSGIYLKNPISRAMITGNQIFDSGVGTAKYGITVDNNVAITNAFVAINDVSGVTTTPIYKTGSSSISGEITNNKGYHPGPATVTPGASPWTYTAGPEPTYLYVSGGTVSGITKAGVALPTSGAFLLGPNEAVVVTYSAAPTVVADRK